MTCDLRNSSLNKAGNLATRLDAALLIVITPSNGVVQNTCSCAASSTRFRSGKSHSVDIQLEAPFICATKCALVVVASLENKVLRMVVHVVTSANNRFAVNVFSLGCVLLLTLTEIVRR